MAPVSRLFLFTIYVLYRALFLFAVYHNNVMCTPRLSIGPSFHDVPRADVCVSSLLERIERPDINKLPSRLTFTLACNPLPSKYKVILFDSQILVALLPGNSSALYHPPLSIERELIFFSDMDIVKQENNISIDTVIWAKYEDWPYWPCKVVSLEEANEGLSRSKKLSLKQNEAVVSFFDTIDKVGVINLVDVEIFYFNEKDTLRCKNRWRKTSSMYLGIVAATAFIKTFMPPENLKVAPSPLCGDLTFTGTRSASN